MIKELILFVSGVSGIIATLFIFGVELPLYLGLSFVGLSLYIYSENPLLKFVGGWLGRICAVLFFVSLFYYLGTRTFFPDNPFEFRFLFVGLEFVNEQSQKLGGTVLNLFR